VTTTTTTISSLAVGAEDAVLAIVAFEPCPAFLPASGDAAVCEGCGWLDSDHAAAGA
jgi:hypothetical protein